jgi:LuxR family maltose regulon positive regulatory protein
LLVDAGPSTQADELRSRAHHLLAACHTALDQLDEARQHQHMAPPDPTGDLPTHAYSAWLAYRDGRLDHALSYAEDLLVMTRKPWNQTMSLVARGAVRRERNQLGEADGDLRAGVAAARRWSRAAVEVLGAIELAHLRFAQRREAEAFTVLTEARPRALSSHLLQRVELAEALLWLRAGDVERSLFGREELPDGHMTAELDVRLALAAGPVDEVPERLARLEAGSRSLPERITTQLLRARLALAWDDDADAERHLRTAIEWGRREQFVQRFAPDLPALEGVLRAVASGYDDPYPFSLLAAIADQGAGAPLSYEAPAEFEPLSEREQIVLRYLPTGLSNKRIAAELHMSVNTLKTHLKSIYRKLGAGSRDESVAHARQLHLL